MSRRVIFRRVARVEFDEAIAWYEQKRPGLGAEFEAGTNALLERIKEHPGRFRSITPHVRRAPLKRFGYFSIYFTEAPDRIGVLAVFHAKRDPEDLRERLK